MLLLLLGYEVNIFLQDVPRITDRLHKYSPGIQDWLKNKTGISSDAQSNNQKIISDAQNGFSGILKILLSTAISSIFMLVMIPVYASLLYYNRGTFVKYLESDSSIPAYRDSLHKILHQSIFTYFHFVKGTFFVYLIVGVLNSAGLFLLGIQHALFWHAHCFHDNHSLCRHYYQRSDACYYCAYYERFSMVSCRRNLDIYVRSIFGGKYNFPGVCGTQLNLSTWSTLVAIVAGTIYGEYPV